MFYKVKPVPISSPYKIMTVKIDLSNPNPATCCTYHDDAKGMKPGSSDWDEFFGHYPCLFKNGQEVGKLKRDNFAQFENGSSADITSGGAGDVMIAFPRKGVRISTSGNILTVSMTDDPNNSEFKYYAHTRGNQRRDKFYLGAYKGYYDGSKLRSLSGQSPTGNQSIGNFRTYAQANGQGYEQSAFYQLTFRQVMYLLKYKNLNSQNAVGMGYVKAGHLSPINTGGSEAYGMDSEIIKRTNPSHMTDQEHHVKLFGLEDFWGNINEFIDGIRTNRNKNILIGTNNFNNDGVGYISYDFYSMFNIYGYISKPQGTTEMGFILKENEASDTSYFCDYAQLDSYKHAFFGGSYAVNSVAGAFTLYIGSHYMSLGDSNISSRLMYL